MARILCNVAGGGKPLKGNAEPGDVLAGKTFSNKQSNALTGSMPNNGAWSASTSGNGSVTIPAGYHNGSGTVSGAASYNSGYANGVASGKGTNATVTILGAAGGAGGVYFSINLTVNSNGTVHVNSITRTGSGGEPYDFDGVRMGLTITGTDGSSVIARD